MTWTTVPSFVVALCVFVVIGLFAAGDSTTDALDDTLAALRASFDINVIMLVPVAVVVYMASKKKPAVASILASTWNDLVFDGGAQDEYERLSDTLFRLLSQAAVEAAKGGEVQFKAEKGGVVHAGVGKASFEPEKLAENVHSFVESVRSAKPVAARGTYIQRVSISSSMGPGLRLDIA